MIGVAGAPPISVPLSLSLLWFLYQENKDEEEQSIFLLLWFLCQENRDEEEQSIFLLLWFLYQENRQRNRGDKKTVFLYGKKGSSQGLEPCTKTCSFSTF
jgi:hypothetical protein